MGSWGASYLAVEPGMIIALVSWVFAFLENKKKKIMIYFLHLCTFKQCEFLKVLLY
jgi:hypothetical protein